MKNFYNNRKNISAFVSGAILQHFAALKEGRDVEFSCDTIKTLTSKAYDRETIDSYYKDTLAKVEQFFNTGRITGRYSDFQAQLCLDLEQFFK